MSPQRPTHAVVSAPALDVRARPDHRSELKSQLLMGEGVRVVGASRGRGWWLVSNLGDGYVGWARTWGLIGASRVRLARWRGLATARVVVPWAELRARPGAGAGVSPMPWNARAIPGPVRGRHRRLELPDGRRGWLPRTAVAGARTRPPGLVTRVRDLLGAPYLWGGRTPAGFDCSGFVQQLFAERGVPLPRDAAHQWSACRRIARERAVEGDLVFFGAPRARVGHVGVWLGADYFAHARGWVRVASLDPGNPLCDNELTNQLRGFGRPLESRRSG